MIWLRGSSKDQLETIPADTSVVGVGASVMVDSRRVATVAVFVLPVCLTSFL